MRKADIKWAVLRIEGTNSEDESAQCMRDVGVQAEIVHLKQLTGDDVTKAERRKLSDYDGLWIAGGFSAGDYIRAGAILAARMKSKLAPDIKQFIQAGKPMLGICNGFQIMVELGVLPNLEKGVAMTEQPTSVLHLNDSGHYECRPSLLRHVNAGTCKFTTRIPTGEVRTVITSHAEGKFMLPSKEGYRRLADQDQIVFQYTDPEGSLAPKYPWLPNGAPHAIAGVCNPEGTVFGMMPHPERVFWRRGHPDWTRTGLDAGRGLDVGDGRAVFESIVDHQVKRL
ncbi:MAG TPA: phosphoribosylformylglycinamidine synthase I [Candidatus Thermoplasmatota archaeon]|nr:phosphoribosylformylglycinamidine synthase I [Candidatus Thermoplasmatota archaeon]